MFGFMDEIKRAREALDAQTAAWVAKVGAYDRSEHWRADGYGSVEAAIADACRIDRGVVHADVKLARKLEQLPLVAEAFAEGAISQRHASVIATAATPARMAEFTNLEREFVDAARKCPPKELAGIVRYVTDALDGDGGADAEDRIYQRRRYHQSSTLDGMLATDGLFDPESAGFAESALRIARDRDERDAETRTTKQRNADAFTMIMRQWLELTDADTPDHVRRHAVIVVDLAETPGVGPELIAHARAERRRIGHLSEATLERIACDGHLSRVIMFGTSEVLDVGRT
ncbi:MAG: endonuclease, partial [Actinomycetia bacterium]|nr:endonuclease [Actinomycetes bacterium]